MPIDPGISLAVKPIQLDNPVESYGKALGLKALMLHNQTQQQSFEDAQRLRSIYSQPEARDPSSLRDLLYKSGVPGGVQAGVTLDKDVLANQAQAMAMRKSQLDNVMQQHAIASSAFGSLGSNPSLDQINQTFQYLQSKGLQPDTSDAPKSQEEVPAWMQKVIARGQTVGEQLTQAQRQWERDFKTTGQQQTLAHQTEMERQGKEHIQQGWIQTDPFGTLRSAATNFGARSGPSTAGAPDSTQSTGAEFLSTIPKPLADQVKALSEGRLAFPAGFALKSPYWQNMLQMVSQYDPTFDAINFNARVGTRKDFTSGTSAKSITALNTVIGHLNTFSKAADALDNTNLPAYNSIANWVSSNSGDPRVKQFENTRKAVADELTRVWRGTGGAEGDIQAWLNTMSAAGSPAQLHGVIKNIGDLLESRINALQDQYKRGMGTTEQPMQFLTREARTTLDRLEQKTSGVEVQPAAPVLAPPGTPLPKPGSGSVQQPTILQKGQSFTTNSGTQGTAKGGEVMSNEDGKNYVFPDRASYDAWQRVKGGQGAKP